MIKIRKFKSLISNFRTVIYKRFAGGFEDSPKYGTNIV